MSKQHNRLYAHYLSGIITEAQYHEAMAELPKMEATDDTGTVAVYPFGKYQNELRQYLKNLQEMEMVAKRIYEETKEELAFDLLKKIQTIGSTIVTMSDARQYGGHMLAKNPNLKSWR